MFKEFKEFAMRGNVVDLAVGVIIGAAFGKIVNSFVADIMMPPLGLLLGQVDFSNLFINLSGKPLASLAEAKTAGVPTINYGFFINQVIDFLIVAFAIFDRKRRRLLDFAHGPKSRELTLSPLDGEDRFVLGFNERWCRVEDLAAFSHTPDELARMHPALEFRPDIVEVVMA